MIELGLIVGIDVVGLVLALLMWRGGIGARRGSGSAAPLGQCPRARGACLPVAGIPPDRIATLALLLPTLVLSATLEVGASPVSRWAVAFWGGAGLCLGALGSTLAGYVGTVIAVRGSVRVAAAAGSSIDGALGVAMRAAGSASVLSETLSGLLVLSFFGLLFAIQGGFALPSEQALPLARHVVRLLPGLALGAAVSALVLQRGGGTFHAAGGVGCDQAVNATRAWTTTTRGTRRWSPSWSATTWARRDTHCRRLCLRQRGQRRRVDDRGEPSAADARGRSVAPARAALGRARVRA